MRQTVIIGKFLCVKLQCCNYNKCVLSTEGIVREVTPDVIWEGHMLLCNTFENTETTETRVFGE